MDDTDSEEETTTYFSDDEDDESTRLSTDISYDSSLRRSGSIPTQNSDRQRRVVDLATSTTTTGEDYYTSFDEDTATKLGESTSFASRTSAADEGAVTTSPPTQPKQKSHTGAPLSPRVLDRVPGGAAAKLMLIGPKGSTSDSSALMIHKASTGESSKFFVNQEDVLTSLEHDLMRAKEEFRMGSPNKHRRNMEETASFAQTEVSSSTTPSFLNRNEVFHSTAEAAVAAILMDPATAHQNPKDTNVFASFPSSPAHYDAKPVVSPNLLSKTTEQKVEDLQKKMLDPTATLTGLLTAIATPHDEIDEDELGNIVRRKNACGALQTLTAKPQNCHRICWTVGVLPALTSVLQDGLEIPSENPRVRKETEAAQIRAIFALMNLSIPVKNRIAVFHSPGLVRAALLTIHETTGQPRQGCAAILASLAKSPENRLLLAQVPNLLSVVCKVLKPRPPRVEGPTKREKKKYPWSDENSTDSSASAEHQEAGMSYDDSWQTPKQEGGGSPRELTGYDETADALLQGARQNLFAMLGHLVKEKDNAYHFARDIDFLNVLVDISAYQESPSHVLAIKIIAHLTRHRLNKVLAFKPKTIVPALIEATQSNDDDARLFACYALQNLSQEKSCRQELAIANHLIEVLCERCRNGNHFEERLASISTLKNLCDEPANLIPMTNTTNCVTTLMQMADSSTDPLIQYRACDALATLSHWLRKIATSGYSLDATEKGRPPMKGLFVPTLREVSWNQWT